MLILYFENAAVGVIMSCSGRNESCHYCLWSADRNFRRSGQFIENGPVDSRSF